MGTIPVLLLAKSGTIKQHEKNTLNVVVAYLHRGLLEKGIEKEYGAKQSSSQESMKLQHVDNRWQQQQS